MHSHMHEQTRVDTHTHVGHSPFTSCCIWNVTVTVTAWEQVFPFYWRLLWDLLHFPAPNSSCTLQFPALGGRVLLLLLPLLCWSSLAPISSGTDAGTCCPQPGEPMHPARGGRSAASIQPCRSRAIRADEGARLLQRGGGGKAYF